MQHTKIEWALNPNGTPGYTWNPITGCLNGCEYCYARRLASTRLKKRYLENNHLAPVYDEGIVPMHTATLVNRLDPFYPRFWKDRLDDIIRGYHRADFVDGNVPYAAKPRGIFVCDMSDLFGIGIPEEWTRKVLDVIENSPHRFYLLTKQPQNLIKWSPFPDNCWVGVSATDFRMGARALYVGLVRVEAKVKFLSYEPLLEDVNIMPEDFKNAHINWAILGAQTKPYKPPKIEWVQEIVEACDKAGIPVFLKNNLKPLFQPFMKVPNIAWWGNVFGLRQEIPNV